MENKKILRLVIPIIMVMIIFVIWLAERVEEDIVIQTNIYNEDFELEVSSVNLEKLKEYNLPIILDFGADSCAPCKEMEPVLQKMNSEMMGKAIIKFVDIIKNSHAVAGFPIQIMPTQIFYEKDGTPYEPSEELNELLDFIVYVDEETQEHLYTIHQGGLTEENMRNILEDMGVE